MFGWSPSEPYLFLKGKGGKNGHGGEGRCLEGAEGREGRGHFGQEVKTIKK